MVKRKEYIDNKEIVDLSPENPYRTPENEWVRPDLIDRTLGAYRHYSEADLKMFFSSPSPPAKLTLVNTDNNTFFVTNEFSMLNTMVSDLVELCGRAITLIRNGVLFSDTFNMEPRFLDEAKPDALGNSKSIWVKGKDQSPIDRSVVLAFLNNIHEQSLEVQRNLIEGKDLQDLIPKFPILAREFDMIQELGRDFECLNVAYKHMAKLGLKVIELQQKEKQYAENCNNLRFEIKGLKIHIDRLQRKKVHQAVKGTHFHEASQLHPNESSQLKAQSNKRMLAKNRKTLGGKQNAKK